MLTNANNFRTSKTLQNLTYFDRFREDERIATVSLEEFLAGMTAAVVRLVLDEGGGGER